MTRSEMARRLHDLVDRWFDENNPLTALDCHMLLKITFRSTTDPDDPGVTLVVGDEPAQQE